MGHEDFEGFALSIIPKDIFSKKDLTYLNLRSNRLQILPDEIWGLTNLKFLNLSSNQITNVSNQINNFTLLKHILVTLLIRWHKRAFRYERRAQTIGTQLVDKGWK